MEIEAFSSSSLDEDDLDLDNENPEKTPGDSVYHSNFGVGFIQNALKAL